MLSFFSVFFRSCSNKVGKGENRSGKSNPGVRKENKVKSFYIYFTLIDYTVLSSRGETCISALFCYKNPFRAQFYGTVSRELKTVFFFLILSLGEKEKII